MENKFNIILLITLLVLMAPIAASALDYPHDDTNGYKCTSCHSTHMTLGTTSFNNVCISCHRPGDAKAGTKPFYQSDASNIYGTIQNGYSGGIIPRGKVYQTSHNWAGSDTNPQAGASPPTDPYMTTPTVQGKLLCARCHSVHGPRSSATNSPPFLRIRNDNNEICLDCHRVRNTSTQMTGSHPININYSTAKLSGTYNTTPANVNPSNPTSALKLVNGKILCTTCHGVHYTDSRSGSYQNHSSFANLSTSKGMLLRTNARGKTANDPNICTNCHVSKVNHNYKDQNIQCNDCHSGHVEYDKNATTAAEKEPNKFLIRRYMNVSTAFGKFTSIRTFYRYTGATTKEFFLGGDKTQNTKVGVGICQACHNNTTAFTREHYASGTTLKDNHKKCDDCHAHKAGTGSFSGGCTSCHGYPPRANVKGGALEGYAVYSGNSSPPTHRPYTSATGRVDESRSPHTTHADGKYYSFGCKDCHNNNNHYNGDFQQVFPSSDGVIVSTFGAVPGYDKNNYTCSAMYCHSNAQGGGYKNVTWKNGKNTITTNNATRCQSCHADKNNAASLSGAHQKHAAPAPQADFACQNCHAATLAAYATFDNNTGLVYPAKSHVNGSKDIKYGFPYLNPSRNRTQLDLKVSGTAYDKTNHTCATIYCHSNGAANGAGGFKPGNVVPFWNISSTGKCGACHKVLPTTETGASHTRFGVISSNAHFEHLSSVYGPKLQRFNANPTAPSACLTCHDSFVAEAIHVDGVKTPNTSAGTACQKCHGDPLQGSPTWTKNSRIACTQCHPIWDKYSAARLPSGVWPSGETAPKQINYSTVGHGKSAAPFNKQIMCNNCHDPNSAHLSTTGQLGAYKRLLAFGNFTGKRSGSNAVCNSCHWGGQSARNKIMFGHVTSVSEARNGTPTMACSKCHDVHGSTNDHMIRTKFVFSPRSSVFIAYESPYSSVGVKRGPYKFIDPVSNNGLCQVCHTKTTHFKRGHNEANGLTGGTSNPNNPQVPIVSHRSMSQSTNCLGCHAHNPPSTSSGTYAFYPFGKCDACHGYPPLPNTYVKGPSNYSSGKFEDYSGGGGSHRFPGHVSKSANPAQSWDNCNSCHSEADHLSVPEYAQVKVTINPAYRFYSAPGVMAKYTSNRLQKPHRTGTCYNVSCHFQRTPTWSAQ